MWGGVLRSSFKEGGRGLRGMREGLYEQHHVMCCVCLATLIGYNHRNISPSTPCVPPPNRQHRKKGRIEMFCFPSYS